jgi:hypothetical protein
MVSSLQEMGRWCKSITVSPAVNSEKALHSPLGNWEGVGFCYESENLPEVFFREYGEPKKSPTINNPENNAPIGRTRCMLR